MVVGAVVSVAVAIVGSPVLEKGANAHGTQNACDRSRFLLLNGRIALGKEQLVLSSRYILLDVIY